MSSKRKANLGIQQPQEPADTCFFHWDRMPPAGQWAADRSRDWQRSSALHGPDPNRLQGGSWHFLVARWCSVFRYQPADQRCRWPVLSSPGLPMLGIQLAVQRILNKPLWMRYVISQMSLHLGGNCIEVVTNLCPACPSA